MTYSVDVCVLGGGAAGLFCAQEAGKRGRSVLVLERNSAVGRKIRISGGGRCNFTNLNASPDQYCSSNPAFCRSPLARFEPADFIALVEAHGIPYYEKKLGQLFCEDSADAIIALLLDECAAAGVQIVLNARVGVVTRPDRFHVQLGHDEVLCESLVVATGGLSIPKIGATGFGYELARQFGLAVTPLRPGLVPLTYVEDDREAMADLAGIAIDCRASCNGMAFRENLLFTHRGLSGPAILQISTYWNQGEGIEVDLLPAVDLGEALRSLRSGGSRVEPVTLLNDYWPQRLARRWSQRFLPSKPIGRLTDSEIHHAAKAVHAWTFRPSGTEGYQKAEVTVGGVDTRELSPRTMEARKVQGLYFIGEVVDVTGWLGGYNFQWAWASGFAAGQHA